MYSKIFLFILFFVSHVAGYAQTVSNIQFRQEAQTIVVNYDITGAMYWQKFNVDLYVSMDGGNSFTGPMQEVSGDAGKGIEAGRNKSITWNVIEERPDFGGSVVFDVRAKVINQRIPKKFYVGYKGSFSAPFGAVIGLTGKTGFYASARINPGYLTNFSYETDGTTIADYGESGYYVFSGNEQTQQLSVTAGIQFQLGRKVHLYFGGGYAMYNLMHEIDQFEYPEIQEGTAYVKHTGESFSGAEAEAGFMIELGHLFISAGATSPGFEWIEPALSMGIIF